jgi:hypothetical protein
VKSACSGGMRKLVWADRPSLALEMVLVKLSLDLIVFGSISEPAPTGSNIDEYQRQDLRIKWLTLLVTFLGFAGTIATIYIQFAVFNSQQKNQQQEARIRATSDATARADEYKKQFWEKQLDFFAEACQATGTITYAPVDSPEFKQASAKFEELFWGRLAIVESDHVAGQMVAFRGALPNLLSAKSDEEKAAARETLQNISLELAHQCRQTVADSFQVKLSPLPPLTELKKHELREPKDHD